jgi:hypothetical protein
MTHADRRLAAILSADVVGYSRLMGEDEPDTIAALAECFALFRRHLEEHDGRLVDTAGDSLLAVFESVTDAVLCAMAAQYNLADWNDPRPAPPAHAPPRRRQSGRDIFLQADGLVYGDADPVGAAQRRRAVAAGFSGAWGAPRSRVADSVAVTRSRAGATALVPRPQVTTRPGQRNAGHLQRRRRPMRLTSLVVASVVSAISCIAVLPSAHAQKTGGRPPIRISSSTVLAAGDVFGECAFPVRLDSNGKAGTINLPGGRMIFTSPGLHATLTNLNEPTKSVTLNITGTFHQSTDVNGDTVTVVTGRNILGDPDAGFVLAIGSFSFKFDAANNLVQPLAGHGQLTKICPLIA